MTDNEILELLVLCHPVYLNLHDHLGHILSEKEAALLRLFKFAWEDSLCLRPELIKQFGMDQTEVAFLGGYVYFSHQLVVNEVQ